MKSQPWLRLYTDIIDDEKLGLLAFEDRWHFMALLACKGRGLLDRDESPELMRRKIALKLGLVVRELDEVARRLSEVGLIDRETLQPLAWDKRQFNSDNSTERVRAYRERQSQKARNADETFQKRPQNTDTDTDTEVDVVEDEVVVEKTKTTPSLRSGVERASRPESAVPLASQTEPPDCAVPAPEPPPARKRPRSSASPPPCPEDVDAQLWADWLAVRKAKRAPLTATALAGVQREADKAGITLAEALRCCVEAGWQGFRAEWFARLNAPAAPPRPGHAPPAESFRERDARLQRERYARLTGRPLDAPAAPFIDVEIASPAPGPGLPPRPVHSLPNPDSSATERRAT